MLDRPLIEQHLLNMEEALGNLVRYRALHLDAFEKDLSLIQTLLDKSSEEPLRS